MICVANSISIVVFSLIAVYGDGAWRVVEFSESSSGE